MNHILMVPHSQSLKGEGKENNRDKKKVWDNRPLCDHPKCTILRHTLKAVVVKERWAVITGCHKFK